MGFLLILQQFRFNKKARTHEPRRRVRVVEFSADGLKPEDLAVLEAHEPWREPCTDLCYRIRR